MEEADWFVIKNKFSIIIEKLNCEQALSDSSVSHIYYVLIKIHCPRLDYETINSLLS